MIFPLQFKCNPHLPRCLSVTLPLSINFNFTNFIKLLTFYAVLLTLTLQGSTNCMHGDEYACNVHAKRLSHTQNSVHVN